MLDVAETKAGVLIQSSRLKQIPTIAHGFGVKGVTVASYLDVLGIPDRYTFDTEQVHGNDVHYLMWPAKKTKFVPREDVEAKQKGPAIVGDAFISDRPGMVCSVRTADCVPILISHRNGKFVGAIHAGWKGTASNIVGATIKAMENVFGANAEDLLAVIGPSIAGENYEVGDEVIEALNALNVGDLWRIDATHVDLGTANCELLKRAGIPEAQIERIAIDTFADKRFSSWRRDKGDDRQLSFIMIRGQ